MCHVLTSATEGDFQIVNHHTPTNPERYIDAEIENRVSKQRHVI
jgi:hypothetical protein